MSGETLRYKFFPGSELSPPHLLGGVVDLDNPQHLVANVFIDNENHVLVKPINREMPEAQLEELNDFAHQIRFQDYRRIPVDDIMYYTSRRKAMC